jgi:hypothetical protein
MNATTDHVAGRPRHRLLRPSIIVACATLALAVGVGVRADTPQGRRPGEPLVEAMGISSADRAETLARVGEIARGLGIPGQAATPRRTYHALDLRVVDETEVTDRRGQTIAVIRTDGATGALRSVVRLDWSADADRPRVDRSAAATHARHQARLSGLMAPAGKPTVRWDETMDAWRVDWIRRIDDHLVLGDGLTVWVHRGGQLAALRQAETSTAPPPLEQVEPEAAATAAREWAVRHGVPSKGLVLVVAPAPVWVRPNDFLVRGGADDTDPLLRLAYRVDLTMPIAGSSSHHIVVFVDAGSGGPIAGAETS